MKFYCVLKTVNNTRSFIMKKDEKQKSVFPEFMDNLCVKLHPIWKEPVFGNLDFRDPEILKFINKNIGTYNRTLNGYVTVEMGNTTEITDDNNVKGYGVLYAICSENDKHPLYWFVIYFKSSSFDKIPFTKETGLSGRAQSVIRSNLCDENTDFYNHITYKDLTSYQCRCGTKTLIEIYEYVKKNAPDSMLCKTCEENLDAIYDDKVKKHV